MIEKIKEIEKKINTKEELDFFLQQIDLANDLILKNLKKEASQVLEGKIVNELFSALLEIEKEKKEREEKSLEKKKEQLLKEKKETEEKLNFGLRKERELERKLMEIEAEEEKKRGTEKEKEIERERWALEEERIKIEKEKWELKEKLKKLEKELKEIKPKTKEDKKEEILFFLQYFRDYLLSLPKVNLEIAFSPSSETIFKIANWFQENFNKKFILDFKINPKIVGGAIIEHNGKIFNFSIFKEIKKEIERLKHGDPIEV